MNSYQFQCTYITYIHMWFHFKKPLEYYACDWILSLGWFSNRTGTSFDDKACKSNNWLDQWQSEKLGTGRRVYSFSSAFPSSNDVPVLLLNQPIVRRKVTWVPCQAGADLGGECRGCTLPQPPRWSAAFQYNWYSAKYADMYGVCSQQVNIMLLPSQKPSSSYTLLKFVYVISQLCHFLVAHPLLRKSWIPPWQESLILRLEQKYSQTLTNRF